LWAQGRNLIGGDDEFDAPRLARLPANQAALFEHEDHAVDRRRRHTEEVLDISLGWGTAVEQDLHVNERQVLPLLVDEARCRRGIGHRGNHVIDGGSGKGATVNLRYRVTLSSEECAQLQSLVGGEKLQSAEASAPRFSSRLPPGQPTRGSPRMSGLVHPRFIGPNGGSSKRVWRRRSAMRFGPNTPIP